MDELITLNNAAYAALRAALRAGDHATVDRLKLVAIEVDAIVDRQPSRIEHARESAGLNGAEKVAAE